MNNRLPADKFSTCLADVLGDISTGLAHAHTRINDNTKKALQATSFLYALIEVLNDKGIITIEELDTRKRQVAERLVQHFTESGLGLVYQDPEMDKYHFDQEALIDCSSRLSVCKAVCCKIPFALSRQDVEEGIVRWNFSRPYMIAHGTDGYCVHLDRDTYQCTIHAHRTVPCRGFDCKASQKWAVWQDYDNMILNPDISERIRQSNGHFYRQSQAQSDGHAKSAQTD